MQRTNYQRYLGITYKATQRNLEDAHEENTSTP